ncbi:MAG: MarR family transcriptional regulator [Acidobacteria bacterium]|nr:MAG: MarR family transcriptional regulator [Acidobacteriota bacterium]REK11523.1 MAG: MarR family transcriptional regulator [Acidobacteriota bacterium]
MYDERILRSLRRIIRAVDIHSKHLAQHHRLTAPQLVCLRELRSQGPISAGRLAQAVSLSPATITGIVDRMERRGLVQRTRSEQDRRQVVVQITDKGVRRTDAAPLSLNERFSRRLARLPEEVQARIDQALSQVAELMEAEQLEAPPAVDVAAAAEVVAAASTGGGASDGTRESA